MFHQLLSIELCSGSLLNANRRYNTHHNKLVDKISDPTRNNGGNKEN